MASRGTAAPFHSSLDTPLLDFGGEPWRIRDFAEAVLIVGAPGSGKTSASAKALRMAGLRAGMGMVGLCAKIEEADMLIKDVRAAGRGDDLVVIDASGKERFNILDFAANTLGGPGFEGNIVEIMRRMNEAAKIADPNAKGGGGGENSYFEQGAMKWLSNAFPLLLLAEGSIRLNDLNRFITSLPNTPADVEHNSPAWQRWSKGYCSKVINRAFEMATKPGANPNAVRIFDQHGTFFLEEIPNLDNRPRSSIASTLTNLISPLLSGKLAELFCTDTTITPQACREGKIIIMDLPTVKYGITGAVAQSLFKYLFGVSAQNDRVTEKTRPVMLYMDEVQNFLSSTDADLLAMARGSKICSVFITQDYPTFFAKLGESDAKSLLGKFGTRIFHANSSHDTNVAASDLIGKVQKFHVGETVGSALNAGTGGNQHEAHGGHQGNTGRSSNRGQSSSGYMDYDIPPDHFASKLRTGAKRNGYKVDGILTRTGKNWKRTGRHWLQAEFDQRM